MSATYRWSWRTRLKLRWLWLRAVLASLLIACAHASTPPPRVCGPCVAPSSGPVVLDEVGVRELLAGVALEEGDLAAQRDEALTGKSIAERYAAQIKRDAVVYGSATTAGVAAITALLVWLLVHK